MTKQAFTKDQISSLIAASSATSAEAIEDVCAAVNRAESELANAMWLMGQAVGRRNEALAGGADLSALGGLVSLAETAEDAEARRERYRAKLARLVSVETLIKVLEG